MGSMGGFYKVEKDGKLVELVYYHPKYHPIPQSEDLTSFGETPSQDHLLRPIFLCPIERRSEYNKYEDLTSFGKPMISSPEYVYSETKPRDHSIILISSYNNWCAVCNFSEMCTNYYFCHYCKANFHKECVESPIYIRHPYHRDHSLRLCYYFTDAKECLYCGENVRDFVYQCTMCDTFMHTVCAMKSIPFVIDHPKRHEHNLTLFPRQSSLTCNVCGFLRNNIITFVCVECNFVSHKDCMYSPNIIKISRHHHRISYTSSLPFRKWSCGVCHQSINTVYGAYTCDKCGDYAVHSRCALREDVCDGVELEGVPVEDDIIQDVQPFEIISEGVILHFLHDHHLQLEVIILYDENKFCQACGLPIFEGNIYSCMECDFILHEICAKAHRTIQHELHPHQLTLMHANQGGDSYYRCDACRRYCNGFVYGCPREIYFYKFNLDIQCASISEPFHYKYHEHPLFLPSEQKENLICHLCKTKSDRRLLYCIECNFILCIGCATLPERTKYKHDKHFLTIKFGKEVSEKDWCEVCERNLGDTNTKMLYWCDHCCTAIHIECLFGGEPSYMKPGIMKLPFGIIHVLSKNNNSRLLCDGCKNRCQGNILKKNNLIACSMECADEIFW